MHWHSWFHIPLHLGTLNALPLGLVLFCCPPLRLRVTGSATARCPGVHPSAWCTGVTLNSGIEYHNNLSNPKRPMPRSSQNHPTRAQTAETALVHSKIDPHMSEKENIDRGHHCHQYKGGPCSGVGPINRQEASKTGEATHREKGVCLGAPGGVLGELPRSLRGPHHWACATTRTRGTVVRHYLWEVRMYPSCSRVANGPLPLRGVPVGHHFYCRHPSGPQHVHICTWLQIVRHTASPSFFLQDLVFLDSV